MFRRSLLPFLLLLLTTASADILWPDCIGLADDPSIGKGNYYNLCIRDHDFINEEHPWRFTKSKIADTLFDSCNFVNNNQNSMDFDTTTWTNVDFNNCKWGSYSDNDVATFERVVMTNVRFHACTFHSSVKILFSNFQFNNVTFENCHFQADSKFELGTMNQVVFKRSYFRRSHDAVTPSEGDSLMFQYLTIHDMLFKHSLFVNPVRFEGISGSDIHFNETTLGALHCHSPPTGTSNTIQRYSGFNHSAFQSVVFNDKVSCDRTTFKGLHIGNTTMYNSAYFSNGDILDLYVDRLNMTSRDGTCHELSFKNSVINRRVFANVTIDCKADFENTRFQTVYIKNFYAAKPNFKNAVFSEQEYIDGQCCSTACRALECLCNITDTSGECPVGRSAVNLTYSGGCFPASATLQRENGMKIRMDDLQLAEPVAIGNGKHSDVYFFGHKLEDQATEFVSITTGASHNPLRLSPDHYLYINGRLATAKTAQVGDHLRAPDGTDSLVINEVTREMHRGLYAPTSLHGDLLVDGVLVSSYTSALHPGVAHKLLHPLRLLYRYGFDSVVSRFTIFHQRSWGHVANTFGLAGPDVVMQE